MEKEPTHTIRVLENCHSSATGLLILGYKRILLLKSRIGISIEEDRDDASAIDDS